MQPSLSAVGSLAQYSTVQYGPDMSEKLINNKASIKSQDQSQSPPPEYLVQKPVKSYYAVVVSTCVIVLLVLVAGIVQFSSSIATLRQVNTTHQRDQGLIII